MVGCLQTASIAKPIATLLSWAFARDVTILSGNPFESTARCLFIPLIFFPPSIHFSDLGSPLRTLWLSMTATVACDDFPCESLAFGINSRVKRSKNPIEIHLRLNSYTVRHFGKSLGKSFHWHPVLIRKNKALRISNMSAFDFVLKISGNFSKIKLRCLSVKSVVYRNLLL